MSSVSLPPIVAPVQEIRHALVLYGGVSLAIYIFGVVQELHRLVRATEARGERARLTDAELSGSERVYRALGRHLGRQSGDGDHGPIRTRFVIDLIAGTSAGGINGVFLAKALNTGASLDPLRELWLHEADLLKLIDRSAEPAALLDGGLMYRLLLDALDQLDRQGAGEDCGDLDCYLTATDLRGRSEPLPLHPTAYETSHRHVFHFTSERGDFTARENPLLAFAMRCTSSFPVAFAPMRLTDAGELGERTPASARLTRLFRRFSPDAAARAEDDRQRAYGDGGYLDNKPFTYVTERLGRKRAELPVIRRLLYVEPVPEHPEALSEAPQPPPDALANATAALLDLPRREAIRGDLAAVHQRNRLIAQAATLARGAARDLADDAPAAPDDTVTDWRRLDLAGVIRQLGPGSGTYHRLKVGSVLDDLAELGSRQGGFADTAPERDGLRHLLDVWRSATFAETLVPGDVRPSENDLLLRFDLAYRLRRLDHLARLLTDLLRDDPVRHAELWRGVPPGGDIRSAATVLRRELATVTATLVSAQRHLRSADSPHLARHHAALAALRQPLADLAITTGTKALAIKLAAAWQHHGETIRHWLNDVDALLKEVFVPAARRCRGLLDAIQRSGDDAPSAAVRALCWQAYRSFDHLDRLLFPLAWGTALGEGTPVEVLRISPEDAPSLINETHDRRRKLAGTFLSNFGAFFDIAWRRNDLLWGRLDAAERLIFAALPDEPALARTLLTEAQVAIIDEALSAADTDALCAILARTLLVKGGAVPDQSELERLIGQAPVGAAGALLRRCLQAPELLRHFQSAYEVDRRLDPARSVQIAADAARTAGRMLTTMAAQRPVLTSPAAWLVRLARFASGFAQLVLPGTFASRWVCHWLQLLYVSEGLLFVGGLLTGHSSMTDLAGRLLIATAALHVLLTCARVWLAGQWRQYRNRLILSVMVLVVVTTALLYYASDHGLFRSLTPP